MKLISKSTGEEIKRGSRVPGGNLTVPYAIVEEVQSPSETLPHGRLVIHYCNGVKSIEFTDGRWLDRVANGRWVHPVEFTYQGGHIWTLEEPGPDGYAKTVLSVEIEVGKPLSVVDQSRALTREEVEALFRCINQLIVP